MYSKEPNPRLTFVIVQKRHHFRSIVNQDSHPFNPPPGTIIFSDVTDKDTTNFYLYSHHALQVVFFHVLMGFDWLSRELQDRHIIKYWRMGASMEKELEM